MILLKSWDSMCWRYAVVDGIACVIVDCEFNIGYMNSECFERELSALIGDLYGGVDGGAASAWQNQPASGRHNAKALPGFHSET